MPSISSHQWAVGLWKFSDKITTEALCELASEWAARDSAYVHLYVRRVSKDQFGIGFSYRLDADKDWQTAYREYCSSGSDQLKRRFGNDFVGWDISTPVWIVK